MEFIFLKSDFLYTKISKLFKYYYKLKICLKIKLFSYSFFGYILMFSIKF